MNKNIAYILWCCVSGLILGASMQGISTEIHIISTLILVIFNICIYSIIK